MRYSLAGPLVGLGWTILMTPAVVERWRSPLLGFAPGLALAVWVLWAPLGNLAWYALLVLPTLSLLHYLIQPWMARWLKRATGLPATVVLPVTVGAAEWMRPLVGFAHINMLQTGSFLYMYPRLIQLADVIGSLGLSVVWTIPWAVSVDLLRFRLGEAPRTDEKIVQAGAVTSVALLALLVVYGDLRLRRDETSEGPSIAAVQPSAIHGEGRTARCVEAARELTQSHVTPGSVDLVAWPENAILALYESKPEYRATVQDLARSVGAPILFGTSAVDPRDGRALNAAFLVDGSGAILGRNYKLYTVPFSERRLFRSLQQAVPQIGKLITGLTVRAWGVAPDGKSGERPQLMVVPSPAGAVPFWAPICYETCYAADGRYAARMGARFFVNITSEGWSGWGFCHNQVAVSVLRAVENRVGIVRVGNTGISCFIRPDGRVDALLRGLGSGSPILEPGVLVRRVRLDPRSPTIYSRWGSLIDLGWPIGWVALLVIGVVKSRLRRHVGATRSR